MSKTETKTFYEQYGGTYREENGTLYPNLELPKGEQIPIGKYGRMHHAYLKEHRKGTYTTLLSEGKLNDYLADIDRQANEMLSLLVTQYAEQNGIDENLKATDGLRWVQEMNKARAYAEESKIASYGNFIENILQTT
ncbi:MAG: TnpV protein [Eubacteriales bacterium]|nr:TnpV protein [Eubacteriales bacterium]